MGLMGKQTPRWASSGARRTASSSIGGRRLGALGYLVNRTVLALLIAAIVLPAYLYRRRVQMIKGHIGIVLEERNRIARECHDTLMAGFAAISWQLEATAKLFHDSDLAATPAAKSCDLARSMVSHCQAEARRIIWDLRDSDEMTNLLSQALAENGARARRGARRTLPSLSLLSHGERATERRLTAVPGG